MHFFSLSFKISIYKHEQNKNDRTQNCKKERRHLNNKRRKWEKEGHVAKGRNRGGQREREKSEGEGEDPAERASNRVYQPVRHSISEANPAAAVTPVAANAAVAPVAGDDAENLGVDSVENLGC